ncbi:MAG: hypothetical protein ACJ8H8_00455, partial [Geminicoccaceae bacterium]
RRVAGHAGAAAGALFFLLTPQNLVGAESYMTETVLDLAAALVMTLLLQEILAPRSSLPRLLLLGPMLGLGALAKLTFLPTIGIVWVGTALYRWWRDRDASAFWLRLAVPAVGLALVAWPHYILNSARYLAYARATAGGHASTPVEATGLDFAAYAAGDLVWEVFGLGGTALALAAMVAAVLAWRALQGPERAAVLLPLLAAAPPFLGFLFSRNQTERYLTISMVVLAYPVGLLLGQALQHARRKATVRVMAGGAAMAALVQVALCWLVALGGPVEARPLRPIVEAAWRPNYPCDFTPMTKLLPPGPEVPRLGLFGGTAAVNMGTVLQPFLRAGIPARVIELVNNSDAEMDWPRVMREVRQLDLIILPVVFQLDGGDPTQPPAQHTAAERSVDVFRARLDEADLVEDRGVVSNGPHEVCAVHVLAVRSPPITPEIALRLKPLRPEVHVGTAP